MSDPTLAAIAGWPAVLPWVERVREETTGLRWHSALRRRIPEAAAESRVWGAHASAELDGARSDLAHVRDMLCGALAPVPPRHTAYDSDVGNDAGDDGAGGEGVRTAAGGGAARDGRAAGERPRREGSGAGRLRERAHDPVELTVQAAVRVTAETEYVRRVLRRSPAQAIARLHVAAGSQMLPQEAVGRPRGPGEECGEFADLGPAPTDPAVVASRLAGVYRLLTDEAAPAFVAAALVHAELVHVRPFARGNGLVARAVERAFLAESGLDPTGVTVPEGGHLEVGGTAYLGSLVAYGSGSRAGLELWLEHCGAAWCEGAKLGVRIADAVRSGRLDPDR